MNEKLSSAERSKHNAPTHGLVGKTIACEHGSGVMNSDGVATLNTLRRPRLTRDGRTLARAGYDR